MPRSGARRCLVVALSSDATHHCNAMHCIPMHLIPTPAEEVLLDENEEAKRHAFYMVAGFTESPDHKCALCLLCPAAPCCATLRRAAPCCACWPCWLVGAGAAFEVALGGRGRGLGAGAPAGTAAPCFQCKCTLCLPISYSSMLACRRSPCSTPRSTGAPPRLRPPLLLQTRRPRRPRCAEGHLGSEAGWWAEEVG